MIIELLQTQLSMRYCDKNHRAITHIAANFACGYRWKYVKSLDMIFDSIPCIYFLPAFHEIASSIIRHSFEKSSQKEIVQEFNVTSFNRFSMFTRYVFPVVLNERLSDWK